MNHLDVSTRQAIETLAASGHSRRAIARKLGIDRETVARHLGLKAAAAVPKPAIVPAGSEGVEDSKPAIAPAGSAAGRKSQCLAHREAILKGLEQGLSAQRIYQDLNEEAGYRGSYDAVKRFVRRHSAAMDLPFRRMECDPGAEAQVDYGQGAWVLTEDGTRRRPHVLRVVLSHSRKGYTEAMPRQSTEGFIRGLENALRHFGGVPRTIVIDNLRAAVRKCDWFEPELNPKVRDFCAHYGTVILPTRVATPRHKGKVEAGVKFVQNNALKGRSFPTLAEQNLHLAQWELKVADTRIHGTTRQQVATHFAQVEKPALLPLPPDLFPLFEEAQRTVHRDGHIEIRRAYYSTPPEFVGQLVWARLESRLLRIYDLKMRQIALHVPVPPGRFCTDQAHIHSAKRSRVERGAQWMLEQALILGPGCGAWAQAMYQARGPEAIRSLQGLLSLADKHPVGRVEAAARRALDSGSWRLRELKALLDQAPVQSHFEFLQEHPLIRDLSAYQQLTPDCFGPI